MTDRTISPPGSPLRRRMSEDMTVRGFTAGTPGGYLAAVENFTAFLGRSPDSSDAEDLRRYQLHMRSNGASASSMNSAVSALRFFFGVTLGRGDAEVISLKLPDIDSKPMVIRVEQGKGRKDRYAMLSEPRLHLLRAWWLAARERGVMLAHGSGGGAGCFRARTRSTRSPPASSTAPSTPPWRQLVSTSGSRCTACGTALPPTSWSRRSTSA